MLRVYEHCFGACFTRCTNSYVHIDCMDATSCFEKFHLQMGFSFSSFGYITHRSMLYLTFLRDDEISKASWHASIVISEWTICVLERGFTRSMNSCVHIVCLDAARCFVKFRLRTGFDVFLFSTI